RVVNELRTERAEDAAVNTFEPLPRTRPSLAESHHVAGRPRSGSLTGQAATPRGKPKQSGQGTARPAGAEEESVFTVPTIRLTVPSAGPTGTSVAKPPLPDVGEKPGDLLQSIERIRQAEERFRDVRAEVVDGAVFIRGSVRRGEDQFDLAQQISRLPGVTRVVLAEVRVEPAGRGGR